MNKFFSYIAGLALIAAPLASLTATPAHAQVYTGRIVCQANSPSAVGWGVSVDGNTACNRALYECSLRTPAYQICTVTRWYWEVA